MINPYIKIDKEFTPIYIVGEKYSFYINFDKPISDGAFANFRLDIYEGTTLKLANIAPLSKDVVKDEFYNVYSAFTFPALANGTYQFVITSGGVEKCRSNCILVESEATNVSTIVKYRHKENYYNFGYERLPSYQNIFRLPYFGIDFQYDTEINQYTNSNNSKKRNLKTERNKFVKVESYYFDEGAHDAASAMFQHGSVKIGEDFYIAKTPYQVETNQQSTLSKGTVDAYLVNAFFFDSNNEIIPYPEPAPGPIDYWTKDQSDARYYLKSNPENYITQAFADLRYAPQVHNHDGLYLKRTTDTLTGDLTVTGVTKSEYFNALANKTSPLLKTTGLIGRKFFEVGEPVIDENFYYDVSWDAVKLGLELDSKYWRTRGNALTNATLDFVGTSDAVDLVFRANNVERARILNSTGVFSVATKLAVGSTTATSKVHFYQNDALTNATSGLTIEQAGTGDAQLHFLLTGARRYTIGIDNSDSDILKISSSEDLSTLADNLITLNINGVLTLPKTTGGLFINAQGSNVNAPSKFQSGRNALSAIFGSGDTSDFNPNQYGGAIRFNGAGVLWGDISFYPLGGNVGNEGHFRLSGTGSSLNTTPNLKLGVGELYSVGAIASGTTSPVNKLHIVGQDASPATSGVGQNGVFRFAVGSGVTTILDGGVSSANQGYSWLQSRLSTGYDVNKTLAINPNGGNVSIGTNYAPTTLFIKGTNTASGLTVPGGSTAQVIIYDTDSSADAGSQLLFAVCYDGFNSIPAAAIKSYKVPGVGTGSNQYENGLIFKTSSYIRGFLAETMRLTPEGNMLLGTNVGNTARLEVLSSGNVVNTVYTGQKIVASNTNATSGGGAIGMVINVSTAGAGVYSANGLILTVQANNRGSGATFTNEYGVYSKITGSTATSSTAINQQTIAVRGEAINNTAIGQVGNTIGGYFTANSVASNIAFGVYASATGGTNSWGVYSFAGKNFFNGNTLIGTTTDNGEKFQVNGKATVATAPTNPTDVVRLFEISTGQTIGANTTGSSATLTTTRTIWGQNFNGSANVTGALTSVTDLTMSGNAILNSLIASRVVISDASKILVSSAVTTTELGYLTGATSNIQSQINSAISVSASNLALGVGTSTTMPITNSNGTGVTLPIVTILLAGLASATDKINWDLAYTQTRQWDGGSTGLNAVLGRTSLGSTTVGDNIFTLPNPSAIRFIQINADNSVTALDATAFKTAIGASSGTVTSVSSANSDIGVSMASPTPVLTLNSGTGANQIAKRLGSGGIYAAGGLQIGVNGGTDIRPLTTNQGIAYSAGTTGQGEHLFYTNSANTLGMNIKTSGVVSVLAKVEYANTNQYIEGASTSLTYRTNGIHNFYINSTNKVYINSSGMTIADGGFTVNATGLFDVQSLSTSLTPPTPIGTTKMIIVDAIGRFSWTTLPTSYITSLTTTGTSGPATVISGVLNIPQYSGTSYTLPTASASVLGGIKLGTGLVDGGGGVINVVGGGGSVWGSISGTLSSQTDLNTALNSKLSLSGGTLTGALNGTSISLSGAITATGGGGTSDIRFKKIIFFDKDLSWLDKDRTIAFKWNEDFNGGDNKIHYGYSAQEIQSWDKNLVFDKNPKHLYLNHVELLTLEIKRLKQRVKILEDKI